MSNERRLNLKKESVKSYLSDLSKQNKNIVSDNPPEIINQKYPKISNEKYYVKTLKIKFINSLNFLINILRKTLSKNKYQFLKSIYHKFKKNFFY